MKNAVVIHVPGTSSPALELPEFLAKLPHVGSLTLLGDHPGLPQAHKRPVPQTSGDLIQALVDASADSDHVLYFYGDAPLLREDLWSQMWEVHTGYKADYTFADGFPGGLAGEIVKSPALNRLQNLAAKHPQIPLGRTTLFDLLAKDINVFDLETVLSPVDLRPLRLSFTQDSLRNRLLIHRYRTYASKDLKGFLEVLDQDQGGQRTLPAYFSFQVTDRWTHAASWDPRAHFPQDFPSLGRHMDRGTLKILLDKITPWAGDGVVNLSLWGDPCFHPDFPGLVEEVCRRPGWSALVETPLQEWNPGVWESLAPVAQGKLTWIVEIDAWDPEAYQAYRGGTLAPVLQGVEKLKDLFPGHVYVQLTRLRDTEPQLEKFYKGWKDRGLPVIIQKYDSFAGALPDRKLNDISPLRRGVCWHLKRDMTIFLDGTVVLCREDFRKERVLGNLLAQDPAEIWESGESWHRDHLTGRFGDFCGKCDEFYTYNF